MLDLALQFLAGELNAHFLGRTGASTVEVKLSALVDDQGKYAFARETVAAAVLNIEEERHLKSHLPENRYLDGRHLVLEPDLKLNLSVIFAANFQYYDQALKYISLVLGYFQAHPVFTPTEYPGLPPAIGRLTVELQTLTYEQLNQIWAFVGGKQLPSVVYRVRMLVLQDVPRPAAAPPITTIEAEIRTT
ncbi:MAG: DUF4255 domain-containing protein [Thermodesulfobacteriota bacterium]